MEHAFCNLMPLLRIALLLSAWRGFLLVMFAAIRAVAETGVSRATTSDDELMTRYSKGDQHAFAVLFRRHAEKIFRAALRNGFSQVDAEDLVQQTFVQIHQARHDYRQNGSFSSWMWTIANNLMRDNWRRNRSRRNAEQGLRQIKASREEMNWEPSGSTTPLFAIRKALEALSEAQRQVLVLHFFEELSFAEISRVMGVKEGAVKVRAHRGYRKLKELLAIGKEESRGMS